MAATGREIGDVVHAYLSVEHAARAEDVKQRIEGAGLGVADRHLRLVEVSDRLEEATRSALAGEAGDLEKALNGVLEGLGKER